MNESTSYFVYTLVKAHLCAPLRVLLQNAIWKEQISDLNFSDFNGQNDAILVKGIYAPGYQNTPKVISTRLIDVKAFNNAYKINRKENLFNQLHSTFQPGAVKPLSFYIEKVFEEMSLGNSQPMYIPPKKGTSSEISSISGTVGIDRTTNGIGIIPIGESLQEELEIVYRGSWFTPLWVYLYEEHKGQSMFVEFDCDMPDYYHAFELSSGLRVSSHTQEEIEKDYKKVIIQGKNLHILAKLLDEIKMHGNVGHSFTWYINKKDFKNYDSRQCFDGDGPDYIKRISLTQKNK